MTSKRLPGKVLREIEGKPLLRYVLERLERSHEVDEVVVATSDDPSDDAVADLCETLGAHYDRGPLRNVAARFAAVAEARGLGAVARVSGDSPLLDPAIVDRAVHAFRAQELDLVTNVMPRTFPVGQSVEVVAAAALRDLLAQTDDSQDLEHVTRFFYRRPNGFRILNIESAEPCAEMRFAVDTQEDLERLEGLVGRMERPHWEYGLAELAELYREAGL